MKLSRWVGYNAEKDTRYRIQGTRYKIQDTNKKQIKNQKKQTNRK